MGVGDQALLGYKSYLAIGRETTYGTYDTATAGIDFLSASLVTVKENKQLEEVTRTRFYKKRIGLSKVIEGEISGYVYPESPAFVYLLENAMGGSLTTTILETGAAYQHQFDIGCMDLTYTSLCLNMRKGDSANGQIFEYDGVRVNEFSFTAEIDDALMFNAGLIASDETQTSNDVASVLSTGGYEPLSFVNGRISVENSVGALTATSYWSVMNMEFSHSNNLKPDEGRELGSDVLKVLPVGVGNMTLNLTLRYNTQTAYDAMKAGTKYAAEFEFLGSTLAGGTTRKGLKLTFPAVFFNNAGDPEVGGPDEVIQQEVEMHIMQDDTSSGYACRAFITNGESSYA